MDYQPQERDNVLVYYKGAFTANVLSQISMNIRRHISRSKRVAKRVFSIFIELAQNVALYSAEINKMGDQQESAAGVGIFVIEEFSDGYVLTVGNLVTREDGEQVSQRIESINQLDEKELRSLKIEKRAQPRKDGRHGANIGLIHVALQAAYPFNYQLKEIDDRRSFLLLQVKIMKVSESTTAV